TGSAGVDVATAAETTLTDTQVRCVPSSMRGPLGHGLRALLLGPSSATCKGLFVLPRVIDADFTGVISLMVWTPNLPVIVPAGAKIGQLVPFKATVPFAKDIVRGASGFGSTGAAEVFLDMETGKKKPMGWVTLKEPGGQSHEINMLIDTGADVTIIS
ncbi:POK9 protein, partial [Nothocercus nigrocapillus]|nr:POK9 protein [Nothocercus nigrocapillus]